MKLVKVNELDRYQEIVAHYKQKSCLSNDYIYQKASDLINQGRLFEYCGEKNAFIFELKDDCMRLYYYLNDTQEGLDFNVDNNLVVEILFRGDHGLPEQELEYLSRCGFTLNLRRDQYSGMYKDLQVPGLIRNVFVHKARSIEEVNMAIDLFNRSFDHYSGDYIPIDMNQQLLSDGGILIAKDINGVFAGALHQSIDRNVAWISHVAVLEEFRGRGIGQALLDTFVEQNKSNEKSRYMLWVQAQNTAAVNMYQKKGFKFTNKSTISMIKLKDV